jgi:hypothetical protein
MALNRHSFQSICEISHEEVHFHDRNGDKNGHKSALERELAQFNFRDQNSD